MAKPIVGAAPLCSNGSLIRSSGALRRLPRTAAPLLPLVAEAPIVVPACIPTVLLPAPPSKAAARCSCAAVSELSPLIRSNARGATRSARRAARASPARPSVSISVVRVAAADAPEVTAVSTPAAGSVGSSCPRDLAATACGGLLPPAAAALRWTPPSSSP